MRIEAARSGTRVAARQMPVFGAAEGAGMRPARLRLVKPLLLAVLLALLVKGAIHYKVGAATYDQRVEALAAGDPAERFGAWLMQADPATVIVSTFLREMMR